MTQGKRLAAVMVLAASVAMPAFAAGTGDADYKAKCASCHGADGLAATPMGKMFKIVSFKDPAQVKLSDAEMIASTTKGKGKMPAYEGKLTDAQIKDVIGYIRTLQK
jgi:mono/diheme cytochrome c family protein